MSYVIRVVGLAGIDAFGVSPHEALGKWLRYYDPDAQRGFGVVAFTVKPERAKRFATHEEALAEWKRQSSVKPLRADGKPNRPLSAYTVEIESAP